MRPYLAVLKDSFREAMASRVLWLITGLITIVLFVGLAPFTLREESAARFQRDEFRNGPEFLKLLASQEALSKPTPARRIWTQLGESMQHRLHAVRPDNPKEQAEVLRSVRDELNGMLNSDTLYDRTVWPPELLSGEGQRLVAQGIANLSYEDRRRLNRLLIDAAFPDHVVRAPSKTLYATWFGYRLGAPLPFEPRQLTLLVNFALYALTSFLAGILGVLIAILVTASTVPQTFEPGAVDLLLSKPVSRSLLFLTKFFGASTFILFNAIYLIGGMWIIAGLRFDIWSAKLLLCIPVFLFLFVIYYSVSALTGVIWGNAVVSVCATALFWGLCFAVGTAKNIAEGTFLDPTRLVTIIPVGNKVLAANRAGQAFEWSSERQGWDEIFSGHEGGPSLFYRGSLIGPVYDSKSDRLYAIEANRSRLDFFGAAGKFLVGPHSEQWRRMEGAASPSGPHSLFVDSKGQLIVVGLYGIYRFEGNAAVEHRAFKVLGIDLAARDRSGRFVRLGPSPEPKWQRPFAAALNTSDGTLAVTARGKLSVLVPDGESRYSVRKQIDLGNEQTAPVAFAGSTIVVALADGRVRLFSPDGVEESSFTARPTVKPRKIAASPDGQWFAILYADRSLWLSNLDAAKAFAAPVRGQGDISEAVFSPTNDLLVSDGFGRVTAYRPGTWEKSESYTPSMDTLEILYRYVVTPLYTIFPKPRELDAVVSHLVIGDPIDLFDQDRRAREAMNVEEPAPVDIWRPIWSNLAFLAVMLTITCVYIARKDF